MNKERLMKILIAPHVSEKSTLLAETARQYVFRVTSNANKKEIKRAVEMMFDVKVDDVRTINVRGKSKLFQGRPGSRPFWKKAYVTLSEGHEIEMMGAQ